MSNLRLLACTQCHTIEELEDFDGPPQQDHILTYLLKKHENNGVKHIGALFKVDEEKWKDENVKRDVTKRIAETLKGGETGLGSDFYNLQSTFKADALACWKQHNRRINCEDYRSDKKRITPNTAAERKEAGLPAYRSPKDRYLCDYCPIQSLVEQAARKKTLK